MTAQLQSLPADIWSSVITGLEEERYINAVETKAKNNLQN